MMRRLRADVSAPTAVAGREHRLEATFGLTLTRPGARPIPAQALLSRADLAMQRAKDRGIRCALFAPAGAR